LYKLVIALRYLRKRRITLLPIAGVAIAVAVLIAVMAISDGFEAEVLHRIRLMTADLTVEFGAGGLRAPDAAALAEVVKHIEEIPDVAAVSPAIYVPVKCRIRVPLAKSGGYFTRSADAMIVGIDMTREARVLDFQKCFKHGSNAFESPPDDPRMRIIVGARLVGRHFADVRPGRDWGRLDRGDVVPMERFIVQDPDGALRMEANNADAVVQDVYKTDSNDRYGIYAPIDSARRFGGIGDNTVHFIHIRLLRQDGASVAAVKGRIKAAVAGMTDVERVDFRTGREYVSGFVEGMDRSRRAMDVIFFFIYIVAGFVVASVLAMTALAKTQDVGILRAMGSSARGIAATYLLYGMAIGAAGVLAGLALALAFLYRVDLAESVFSRLTGWRKPVEMELAAIPWSIGWRTLLKAALTSMAIGLAASVLPAVIAARLDPVKAVHRD
jgi:lipoprotein-releasing system permease protein